MAEQPDKKTDTYVMVWDIPTRLFHWTVVVLVFVSWLSADQGYMQVHLWSGLALLALLLFRLIWGLFGSTTARFSNFVHPVPQVLRYLKGMAGGNKLLYAGHNPAGGLMVIALLAVLLAQAITGLFATDGVKFTAPLAFWLPEEVSVQVTNWHGMIFNIILLLVWFHVVAVGFYLLVKGDNLIRPMLTGRKPQTHVPESLEIVFAHPVIALGVLFCTVVLVAFIAF
jgi:cytochrome b